MDDDPAIARYRRWYRTLLRLHSRPYRERFAESMEQTFNDLCRERASAGKGLIGFVLWMFAETTVGILRDNARTNVMQNKNILRIAIGTGLILMIPLVGMQVSDSWNWGPFDFVFMGALLFGAGVAFDWVARRSGSFAYGAAVAIACLAGLMLLWVNAAVGVIGDEELANAMYLGVLAVSVVGAILARFEPLGMARAMLAAAAVQAIIPLIAMLWVPEERFSPGYVPVMCLNAAWVGAWVVSALLFRAAGARTKVQGEERVHGAS